MERLITLRKVKKPIFSIIIPTLNEEKYLEYTLLSLMSQKFDLPYEIIVADSMSMDKTLRIARRYVNKIVITSEKGIAKGRNIGAKHAEGKYLLFLDADTILLPNALEEIYNEIKKKNVSLVTSAILPNIFDITLLFYYTIFNLFSKLTILLKKPQLVGMFLCCKRSDFWRVGGMEDRYTTFDDFDFSEKMKKFGKVKIINSTIALTSPRRFQKWGKLMGALKYLFLYFIYSLRIKKITNRVIKNMYKPIR